MRIHSIRIDLGRETGKSAGERFEINTKSVRREVTDVYLCSGPRRVARQLDLEAGPPGVAGAWT
jgi:hypothetical protein